MYLLWRLTKHAMSCQNDVGRFSHAFYDVIHREQWNESALEHDVRYVKFVTSAIIYLDNIVKKEMSATRCLIKERCIMHHISLIASMFDQLAMSVAIDLNGIVAKKCLNNLKIGRIKKIYESYHASLNNCASLNNTLSTIAQSRQSNQSLERFYISTSDLAKISRDMHIHACIDTCI